MMKTITYKDEAENSRKEVLYVLHARFRVDAAGMPILLDRLITLLEMEKEKFGGLTAITESVNEYFALREALTPEMDSVNPPITDFVNFLFSPNLNPPIIGTKDTILLTPGGLFPAIPTKLKVTIYMGSGWKKDYPDLDKCSPPDLYVKLHLLGVTNAKSKAKNTKIKKDCWTPSWGEEFDFPLCSTEDAQLRVEVYDHDTLTKDDFAGASTLPVSHLRPGIRAVPLSRKDESQCKEAFLVLRFMFV